MVVEPGVNVIDVPVPAGLPPQEPEYHCQVVASLREPVILSEVLLPAQRGFILAEMVGKSGATQFLAITKYCAAPAPVLPELTIEVPDGEPPMDEYAPVRVVLLPIRLFVPNAICLVSDKL